MLDLGTLCASFKIDVTTGLKSLDTVSKSVDELEKKVKTLEDGEVLVDNSKAEKNLKSVDNSAQNTKSQLDKLENGQVLVNGSSAEKVMNSVESTSKKTKAELDELKKGKAVVDSSNAEKALKEVETKAKSTKKQLETLEKNKIEIDGGNASKVLSDILSNCGGLIGNLPALASGLKTLAIGVAIGVSLKAVADGISACTSSALSFDKASNQLQASTGLTNDEMLELDGIMKDIYNNNFGDSFEDIAVSVGEVYRQTGLVGEELQKATEYAYLFSDVFDLDMNETVRGVDALMKQFGI